MYCSNCGTKIDDDAKFCLNCGAKAAASVAAPSVSSVETVYPVQPVAQPEPVQTAQPVVQTEPVQTAQPVAQTVPVQTTQPSGQYYPQPTIFPQGYDPASPTMPPYTQAETPAAAEAPVNIPQAAVQQTTYQEPVPGMNPPYVPGKSQPQVQAPQAMGQTPQYTAAPIQAAPKKKKGKAGLIIVAALLILALIGAGLYYVKSYRPKKQIQDLSEKALAAYDAGDYDSAIGYMEEIYALKPSDDSLDLLESIYVDASYDAYNSGDTLKAIDYAEKGYDLRGDTNIRDMLFSMYWDMVNEANDIEDYRTCLDYAIKMNNIGPYPDEKQAALDGYISSTFNVYIIQLTMAGDTDQALEVLEEAKPYITEDDYNNRLAEINGDFSHYEDDTQDDSGSQQTDDGQKPVVENVTDINTLAQRIAGLTDNDNYDTASFILPVYTDYVFPAIEETGTLLVKLDSSFNHSYVKFYQSDTAEGGYYVYYGDMDASGNRSGEGWILSSFNNDGELSLYFYNSDWENDKANGFFIEYNVFGDNFDTYTCYYGHLKDYLYDGDITIIWKNGTRYYATYHNGIPDILGTDETDGQLIIALDDTGDYWLKQPEGTTQTPIGVEKM